MTAMLTAVIHISDIRFTPDTDTDGSYVENEERLEIGEEVFIVAKISMPFHRHISHWMPAVIEGCGCSSDLAHCA